MAQPSNHRTDDGRSAIIRQAVSISLAVVPFALAFGVACNAAGLSVLEAMGFSTLVFGGSAQFAAVTVLGDGGGAPAAILAGALLNMRSMAFGVAMAPALKGPIWWRALVSQLMIDESTAVGTAQSTRANQRFGYLAGGVGVFLLWNAGTFVGATVIDDAGDLITDWGFDATIPATFLALLWPRLSDTTTRVIAVVGAAIAIISAPLLPPGIPIIAAAAAVIIAKPWTLTSSSSSNTPSSSSDMPSEQP